MLSALLLVSLFVPPHAAGANQEEHVAHIHGAGTLNIVLDGRELLIELRLPAANVVGFEHDAETDAQRAMLKRALSVTRQAHKLFALSSRSACKIESVSVTLAGDQVVSKQATGVKRHRHQHETSDKHDESVHTDFEGLYQYHCDRPEALDEIRFLGFNELPELQSLNVQLVVASKQGAQTLTPARPILNLAR